MALTVPTWQLSLLGWTLTVTTWQLYLLGGAAIVGIVVGAYVTYRSFRNAGRIVRETFLP